MRLALVQFNATVGDLVGNARGMGRFVEIARGAGAELVVFPELALTGYPPKDLLLQGGFMEAVVREAKAFGEGATRGGGLTVVFGTPLPVASDDAGHALGAEAAQEGGGGGLRPRGTRRGIANSLLAYREGRLLAYYDKRLLPTYDVFDEDRYFIPGDRAVVIEVSGVRVGLSICEDLWRGEDVGFADRYAASADPVEELVRPRSHGGPGAQVIINPSASPFVLGKSERHRDLLRRQAVQHGVWVAGVNQVGGNDELVFDGRAMVFDPRGEMAAVGRGFEEGVVVVDLEEEGRRPAEWIGVGDRGAGSCPPVPLSNDRGSLGDPPPGDPLMAAGEEEVLYRALVLGTRDYLRKTGFPSAVLGLSGGIDSAVTAVIAAAAVGRENVLGVSLPSRYSSEGSKTDARELAERLGIGFITVSIEGPVAAFERALAGPFAGCAPDVTEENLQSRTRGTTLMAISNKLGHILLTTGNKSEVAVGYATLYGDMNGGLAVLADVTKMMVYRLARWMNANPGRLCFTPLVSPPIPEASITKPPSAELRPNQTDQDTLPPYEVLDRIIEAYVERRWSAGRVVGELGIDAGTVARVVRMIDGSEFKRKQAAVGLKVTGVAFGSGRRMPIAQRWRG